MKKFSKTEVISLIIIFVILIGVSIPNFMASLRRSRDQVRRDDLGALVHSLDEYYAELGVFPPASPDGKIMDCLKPGDKPYKDKKGQWVFNPISCEWGKDKLLNLVNGKVYLSALPRDPDWDKGVSYLYLSDGARFQIYASMEGKSEAEYDSKIVSENLMCGSAVCNVGRSYTCDPPKTLPQCEEEAKPLKK